MNTISKTTQVPVTASIDESLNKLLDEVKAGVQSGYHSCEQRIQRDPVETVMGAVAVGYCMNRLPMRAIILANVRLITALAPPALFLYGAAKVYEYLQREEPLKEAVGFNPIGNDISRR